MLLQEFSKPAPLAFGDLVGDADVTEETALLPRKPGSCAQKGNSSRAMVREGISHADCLPVPEPTSRTAGA